MGAAQAQMPAQAHVPAPGQDRQDRQGRPDRPASAVLLDRLCAHRLRANEEDRLFGLISITVRATIKYEDGIFSPDLIDDAIQDSLGALIDACPSLTASDDGHRLGLAVALIGDATRTRLHASRGSHAARQTATATAADLSQELSSQEIDAWLDGLMPRQRALAVFLFASDLTRQEIADAVGMPPAALPAAFRATKSDLLKFFRAEADGTAAAPAASGIAIQYREASQPRAVLLAALLASPPASQGKPEPHASLRITGISSDLYAGWSLLAAASGLPPGWRLELAEPLLLESDTPGRKRMALVACEEISDPGIGIRRFLLKAFAIDGDRDGTGLSDTFHLAAATIDNPAARQTLRNTTLSSIETARCLAQDYGTGEDPGLCR